jgi:hypothetical protein
MAAQTLTSFSNYDGPTLMLGLNNGEAITVNGGSLVIDSDVRWNQNAAVFGGITVSNTLGGSVLFEGRNVWELPYSAATGNVPAQAALGSNGVTGGTSGATGELLRVWANGNLTPQTSGGAMPATGWVKLRNRTGNFQGGEVVTLPGGATITISSAGKRSWLHIVGAEAGTFTIPRLANVQWRGEWYELGTTNGADDQTFQFPVADLCPAIWVEKHEGAYAAEGDLGLEPWLNAATRWGTATAFISQDARGKYFGQVAETGVITIARRASNACGFKPAAGLRVFVPNLLLGNSTSSNWSANTINASLATRYEPATTQGGVVDAVGVCCNWYFNLGSASLISLVRFAALDSVNILNPASAPMLRHLAIGLSSATSYAALSIGSSNSGVDLAGVRAVREAQGTAVLVSDTYGIRGYGLQAECFGAAGSALRTGTSPVSASFSRCTNFDLDGLSVIGAKAAFGACAGGRVLRIEYADNLIGQTQTANPMDGINAQNCTDLDFVGYRSFAGLPNVHAYGYFLNTASSCQRVRLLLIGEPVAPYDCGSANPGAGALYCIGSKTVRAQRVYLTNNRSEPVQVNNTAEDVLAINVWGSDAVAQVFDASRMVVRGCRWSLSTVGQSAVYGTHWQDQFTSSTEGAITISCNEPVTATVAEVSSAFATGSGWTAAGGLSMASLGDTVTWTMPYFAVGHVGFANSAPILTGGNVGNHLLEFQVDLGTGWSVWANLTGPNLVAVGPVNPATGVKLKVRATVTVANAANLLTNIRILTATDAVSQQVQYPMTSPYTLTLENVVAGSQVHVETTAGSPLYSVVAASSSVTLPLQAHETGSPLNDLRIKVRKGSSSPYYQPYETLATAVPGTASIYVSQISDE